MAIIVEKHRMKREVNSESKQLTLPLGDVLKRVAPRPIIPAVKSQAAVPADVGRPEPVAAPTGEALPPSHAECVLDAAHNYRHRGWPVLRLDGERALDPDWTKTTASDPMPAFESDSNIGILLGAPAGGLVALHPDWREMCDIVDKEFAALDCPRFGGASAKSCRHLVICNGLGPTSFKLSAAMEGDPRLPRLPNGKSKRVVGEILSTGQQTTAPPSVHPNGERLIWEKRPVRIPQCQAEELKRGMAICAVLALARRLWPSPDSAIEQNCLVTLARLLWQGSTPRWSDSHTRHRFVLTRIRHVVDMDLSLTAEVAGRDGVDETEGFCRAFQIPSEVSTIRNWLNISTPLTPIHPSKGDGL